MNPDTRTTGALLPCPCCGSKVFSEPGAYEICDVCGWEDDPVQAADPDYAGGANRESLNQARHEWQASPKSLRKPHD